MEIYLAIVILLLYRYIGILSFTLRHACLLEDNTSTVPREIYLPKPRKIWQEEGLKKGLKCEVEVWLWPFVKIWDKVKPDPHRRKRVRVKEFHFRFR